MFNSHNCYIYILTIYSIMLKLYIAIYLSFSQHTQFHSLKAFSFSLATNPSINMFTTLFSSAFLWDCLLLNPSMSFCSGPWVQDHSSLRSSNVRFFQTGFCLVSKSLRQSGFEKMISLTAGGKLAERMRNALGGRF